LGVGFIEQVAVFFVPVVILLLKMVGDVVNTIEASGFDE